MKITVYVVRSILFAIMGSMVILLCAVISLALPHLFSGQFLSSVLAALFVGSIACVYCFVPLVLSNLPIYYFREKSTPIYLVISVFSLTAAAALSLFLADLLQSANSWVAGPDSLTLYCAVSIAAMTALAYFLKPNSVTKL